LLNGDASVLALDLPVHPLSDVIGSVVVEVMHLKAPGLVGDLFDEARLRLSPAMEGRLKKDAGFSFPSGGEFHLVIAANFGLAGLVGRFPKEFKVP
jgi:hypothetical protein